MYGILKDGAVLAEFVAPISVISNQPTSRGDSLSLKVSFAQSPAQRWEIECRLEPFTWDADRLFAHFTVKGQVSPYRVRMPQNTGVIRKRTSKSSIHQCSGSRDSTTLEIRDWTGYAPMGTFIKFDGHTKIYMLAEDLRTGDTTMEVYPPLRKSVANESFKHQDDVEMDVLLDTSAVRGMIYTDGILMDLGTVKFLEKL